MQMKLINKTTSPQIEIFNPMLKASIGERREPSAMLRTKLNAEVATLSQLFQLSKVQFLSRLVISTTTQSNN
jgi:hypothetical protein